MDFSSRSTEPQTVAPGTQPVASNIKKASTDKSKWLRIGTVGIIAAVVILLVALIFAVSGSSNKTSNSESTYVDSSKLQAVFLSTGQVYFGNIKTLNKDYIVLTNIYYLQTSSTGTSTTAANANTSVSLVKLGCELHEPYDQMVINSTQVTFWENLQDNGQVAKAVSTFKKDNPTGQKCTDQSAAAGAGTVQNAGNKQ